jgi:hypothetical protein
VWVAEEPADSSVHTQVCINTSRIKAAPGEKITQGGTLTQKEDRTCPLKESAGVGEEAE